jgi:hypothetical protein
VNKLICLFILAGCSSKPATLLENHSCKSKPNQQSAHATMSIKSQMSKMKACFKNYIKFQEESKQTLKVCHTLNIAKTGKVTYSKVTPIEGRISNDLKMCLEQGFWVMNFEKLQLDEDLFVKFPLIYQSK